MNRPAKSLHRIVGTLVLFSFKACPVFFVVNNVIGIVHGVSYGLVTLAFHRFFDAVSAAIGTNSGLQDVLLSAGALAILGLSSQALNGIHNLTSEVFMGKLTGYLCARMNDKASRIDPIQYELPSLHDDINKAHEGMRNCQGTLFTYVTIFTFYLPFFAFMGVYLFTLKPILVLSLVIIFLPLVVSQLLRNLVFSRLEDEVAPVRRKYEYFERCIGDREYFKETRMLGAAGFFHALYSTALMALQKKTWRAERRTGLFELGMKVLTLVGYMGVLFLLVVSLLNREISVGAFAAVFASIGMMCGIMEEIVCGHIGRLSRGLGAVRNFFGFLDIPERTGLEVAVDFDRGIAVSDMSFEYPETDKNVLSDICLSLRAGETVAIVGENGAGKTTLVKLLIGLYVPTEGEVRIGGMDTRDVSPQSIYKGISGVFQRYQRYKMTLGENISISDTEAANGLAQAAKKADLEVSADSYPDGLSTMLSREFDGVDISGGQWQRVAIARGFYRTHSLIVLDEPTAAIDPVEESRLYEKFSELSQGSTAIIVTHRLGSARIADRIIVMDQGRIVAQGKHDELVAAGGKYAELFAAQAQWYVR
jgi:ATP-binding cassette, subfamily B, bacterial